MRISLHQGVMRLGGGHRLQSLNTSYLFVVRLEKGSPRTSLEGEIYKKSLVDEKRDNFFLRPPQPYSFKPGCPGVRGAPQLKSGHFLYCGLKVIQLRAQTIFLA